MRHLNYSHTAFQPSRNYAFDARHYRFTRQSTGGIAKSAPVFGVELWQKAVAVFGVVFTVAWFLI